MKSKIRLRQWGCHRAGFTLTELSIVLIVIGIVLGGIWGAAHNTSENAKVARAIDELGQINSNIRTFYASQNVDYAAQNALYGLNPSPASTPPVLGVPGADFCHYTPLMQKQGIFPYDTLVGTAADNPWNRVTAVCGGVTVGSIQTALAGTANNPVDFVIRFIGVPYEDCMQFLMRNSLTGPETKLDKIIVTWLGSSTVSTTYTSTGTSPCAVGGTCFLPPVMSDANAGCPSGAGTLVMDFRYELGQ